MYNAAVENDAYEVIGEANWQVLENHHSESDEITIKIQGFKKSQLRTFLFHAFCISFFGLPYLIISYYPTYNTLKYKKSSLKTADYVCITDNEGTFKIETIEQIDLNLSNHKDNKVRYFLYQYTRYIWIKDQGAFVNVQSLNEKLTIPFLMENMSGMNKRQQNELLKLYGPNSMEVEVKSYWSIFVTEVFNPFYLFQVFSIVLWSFDEYYQYAACVFILSAGSCMMSLYTTKKMSVLLQRMAGSMCVSVGVLRGRAQCVVDGARLVPGDVMVLPAAGCIMPCDALLLTGTCIVNESMLTGESVPVMKGPPNVMSELYSTETHKRHTLFAGTHVIQTRFYGNNQVLAKVVRTGFYTAKGELIKSILFPKPFGFQFYKDAVKFVIFLFCIAALGMAYCIWLYVQRGSSWLTIVLRTLDIITIVVPPALPAAMTAGTVNSQRRLKQHKIYCLSPPRINVCGKLQIICFDKTGTLTEDGLDLYAVLPHWEVGETFGQRVVDVGALPNTCPLLQALASCHSLTSIDGELTGDPLDLKMFQFTRWVLEEPGPENTRYDTLSPPVVKPASTNESALQNLDELDPLTMEIPYEIGLLRRFHFSSTQQSMGVIARVLGQQQMVYFVKGAPEKIAGMCRPESLPGNFNYVLNDYASNGFRVIGLAYKKLRMKWVDAQRVKRDQLECDMVFLGLLVMQNSLKPETAEVIKDLHDANMRQVMVTGDNIMTAMSVARVCGMVPSHQKLVLITLDSQTTTTDNQPPLCFQVVGEGGIPKFELTKMNESYALAIEGRTWTVIKHHYPELLQKVLEKGTVFGRFGPDQKTQLVVALQGEGLTVGMCGDGANDCGALKAAHIGVSLSQADASVAAPFTSHEQNIRCVKQLALEGRCALSTSFAIFKYMALYSLIQFFSILILYNFYSILGNNQFLYIDLVLTTMLAFSLGKAGPAGTLSPHSPPHSLMALSTTVPLILQVLVVILLQLAPVRVLYVQPWFHGVEGGPEVEEVQCWENTVTFIISAYQYLILACVYSKGQPFRQPFCSNYYMIVTLISQSVFVTLLLLLPWKGLAELMEVVPVDMTHTAEYMLRLYLLIVPVLHLTISIGIEAFLSETDRFDWLRRLLRSGKYKSKPIEESPSSPTRIC